MKKPMKPMKGKGKAPAKPGAKAPAIKSVRQAAAQAQPNPVAQEAAPGATPVDDENGGDVDAPAGPAQAPGLGVTSMPGRSTGGRSYGGRSF